MRVTEHRDNLLRETVESLSLEIFESSGHAPEQVVVGDPVGVEGLDQKTFRNHFQPQPSCDSVITGILPNSWKMLREEQHLKSSE